MRCSSPETPRNELQPDGLRHSSSPHRKTDEHIYIYMFLFLIPFFKCIFSASIRWSGDQQPQLFADACGCRSFGEDLAAPRNDVPREMARNARHLRDVARALWMQWSSGWAQRNRDHRRHSFWLETICVRHEFSTPAQRPLTSG